MAAFLALHHYFFELMPHESPVEQSSLAWLLGGFALWIFVFFAMPKPVMTYVLAHELTHALWAFAMGARVSKLKVSNKGGSVKVSKSNFLITLAPYFFPLYTMLVILTYGLLWLFFDMKTYTPFWLGLIGLSYGFHITFTIETLMQHQSDIAENGWIFSYVIILLFNLIGLGIGISAVTEPYISAYFNSLAELMQSTYVTVFQWLTTNELLTKFNLV